VHDAATLTTYKAPSSLRGVCYKRATTRFFGKTACNPHEHWRDFSKNGFLGGELSNSGGQICAEIEQAATSAPRSTALPLLMAAFKSELRAVHDFLDKR
jgi:hypothetical protein